MTPDWLNEPNAQAVCNMLTDAGYAAWFVGGCVRNALMGEPISDLDLSTDALPQTVMKLAQTAGFKSIPTGIDHGTVTVVVGGTPFEVTTFRKDVETDGRRAVVAFSTDMIDDARRRDFTMNALYLDANGALADPLGGLPDLQARRVRFIEDGDARVKEDYLRILRFFRFHAWYGDDSAGLDPDALAACAENIEGLAGLSKERVGQEMRKLLSAPDPAPALSAMSACGALGQILPGAQPNVIAPLVHLEGGQGVSPDPIRRLAVIGGQDVEVALRLTKKEVAQLAQLRGFDGDARKAGYAFGATTARDMLLIEAASFGHEIDPNKVKMARSASEEIFPLKAADLMPRLTGAALGQALKEAEARWIASNFTLTKDDLLG